MVERRDQCPVEIRSEMYNGGVLSDGEIDKLVRARSLISSEYEPKNLRAARYDVRIAADGLVTPQGDLYRPKFMDGGRAYPGPLVLLPGETAELSSRETFWMPDTVSGNIAIKTEFARQGLLLLSGLFIDPGYGVPPAALENNTMDFDGRLHFFVANVGRDPVVLVPGETRLAAVQFLTISGAASKDRKPVPAPRASEWREGRIRSLGFIEDLRTLRIEHDEMRIELERTRESTQNVIVLGYFLLAATILGLTLNNLLSLGSDATLVGRIDRAVPNDLGGKGLIAALALSIAWTTYSFALLRRARPSASPRETSHWELYRGEALTEALLNRWRDLAWRVTVPAVLVVTSLIALFAQVKIPIEPWVAPAIVVVALAGFATWIRKQWHPITEEDVAARAAALAITQDQLRNASG